MKKKIKIPLYTVLGILSLAAGMAFSGYSRDGLAWIPGAKNLLSQSVPNNENTTLSAEVEISPEVIAEKIKVLEAEIVKNTNDPEKDIQLRTELQSLKSKLK